MHQLFLKTHVLSATVITAALEVQHHFGPGLLESIYVKCLDPRLGDRGIARVILKGADAP